MRSSQLDLTSAIVYIAPGAAVPERFAAEELCSHLRQITGKDYAVKPLPAAGDTPAILLGRAAAEPLLPGFNWAELREDGVVVRTVGNALVLAGATPRGTLYAVYQFLDQVLGCRWLTPDCSVIPRREALRIDAIDIVHTPVFQYREPFFSAVWQSGDWLARNRANSAMSALEARHGGKWAYAGFAHTFYLLVPPEKYFDEHPEYFSEIHGERTHLTAQLCLTNEALVDVVCDSIRAEMRKTPDARIVSITQNDYSGWCECKHCRAIDEAEGSHAGTMLCFVNKVAARLEPEFPHIYFDTFAYLYTVQPPKTVRPRKNVVVRLCNIVPCCDAHPMAACEENAWFLEVLQAWSRIAPALYIWDYYCNFHHYFAPYPNLDAIAADFRLFSKHRVTGVFAQGDAVPPRGSGDMTELRAWVISRLLWDPALDAWALVDEFLHLYYGAAAPFLRAYLDQLHAPARRGGGHICLDQDIESPAVTGDAISRYHSLFDRAEAAVAGDPVLLDRVQAARLPVDYIAWKRDFRYAVQGDRYRPADDALAARLRAFFTRAEAHGAGALHEHGTGMAQMRALSDGYEIVQLANDRLSAGIIPLMGGRLTSLAMHDSGHEWMHTGEPAQAEYPFCGGYEEYSEHIWRSPGWNEAYEIERRTDDELVLSATLENGLSLRRAFRLQGSSLLIASTLGNPTASRHIGCLRTMPEFLVDPLEAATVRFRRHDGSWRDAMPWRATAEAVGSAFLEREEMPRGACELQRDGHALTVHFDPARTGKVLYDWHRTLHFLSFALYSHVVTLEPGDAFTYEQEWVCR